MITTNKSPDREVEFMNQIHLKNQARAFFIFLFLAFLVLLTAKAMVRNADGLEQVMKIESLPNVFNESHGDLVEINLRHEAVQKYSLNQLPQTKKEWEEYKQTLRNRIIKNTGALVNQKLPLDLKETGSLKQEGYTVKNIAFQTRPGVYATANLYIPDGDGKFPAVIVMMGHSAEGRLYDKYQSVGITLALNGYVSLCIDPWGSGERTTTHGVFEDHGDENNVGSALMNIGQPLMGNVDHG
jgi:hypothetical protein